MTTMWRLLLALAALVASASATVDRRFFTEQQTAWSPSDPMVQDAARFAVNELKLLSDSGVYTTLSLHEVLEAATQLGDFHYVTHLRVTLASPYFASQKPLETFNMMVLERKPLPGQNRDSNERSIAIDEFPVMNEDAIEQFWIRKVENRRHRRRELFKQWESESEGDVGDQQQPVTQKEKKVVSLEELHQMPTMQLRSFMDSPSSSNDLRLAVARIIDERLERLQQLEQDIADAASIKHPAKEEL